MSSTLALLCKLLYHFLKSFYCASAHDGSRRSALAQKEAAPSPLSQGDTASDRAHSDADKGEVFSPCAGDGASRSYDPNVVW